MPARVTLLCGPARCGKTERMLARYRQALREMPPASTLWLAPTQRSAWDVRGRLLDDSLPACLAPGAMTFAQFALSVLSASPQVVEPVGDLQKRQLLRRIVDRLAAQGELKHFAPIADTSGLIELLSQFVGELKRREIWPEDFDRACRRRGLSHKDRELTAIYAEYQRLLQDHNLYDAEGRFWSARALLRDGQTAPYEGLRLVVADGFSDFTRTQHEILEVLADRVDELFVTLPLERDDKPGGAAHSPRDGTRRDDLFARPLATLRQFRQRHEGLIVEELPRPEKSLWPALAHVEAELFRNSRQPKPAPDTSGIEILPAARQLGEVELVAAEIKLLLTRGDEAGGVVLPGDVAVVVRSLTDYAALVREVFARFGIPAAIETGRRLDEAPALAALVSLLRLDLEDWPFRRLLAVLGNNYLRPAWPEYSPRAVAACERAIRELKRPQGRDELVYHIRAWARLDKRGQPRDETCDDPRRQQAIDRRRTWAALATPLLERLGRTLAALPNEATPLEWCAALDNLAHETGMLGLIQAADSCAPHDSAAWTRLREGLSSVEQLHAALGESPPRLDRGKLVGLLTDICRGEQLPGEYDETGRVRVLSAATARSLSVPYLFFAGLSERSFPAPSRDDPLYGEAELRQLSEAGLPFVLRPERIGEEMLLFYELVVRPTRRLWLSYPALDEKGQPLLPSPYLAEVERACGAGRIARRAEPDLGPVPRGRPALCEVDFRLQAVDAALDGAAGPLAELLRHSPAPLAAGVLAGLRVTVDRARRDGFGPFEGLCESPAMQARLAESFGGEHGWSASELEEYAGCPFRFYLHRVLGIEPLEELALETNYFQRGEMVHDLLAAMHRQFNVLLGRPASPCDAEDEVFVRLYEEALTALLEFPDDVGKLQAALREIDRRLVRQWTETYRDQHRAYDERWAELDVPLAPAYFETSFGIDPPSPELRSTAQPLELRGKGGAVKIHGRIDRIDVGRLGRRTVFNVVDYKSGKPRPSKPGPVDGTALQLELYAIAVEELLLVDEDAVPYDAGYWYVQDRNGYRPWVRLAEQEGGSLRATADWQERRAAIVAKVLDLVRGVRRGEFPVFSLDDECTGRCPYGTVCRVNHIRSLEKTWPPERTATL